MQKPKDRWPTSSEVADLVGEVRRVCLQEQDRIYLMAVQVAGILEGRATYADTLAVLATIVNKLQEDEDLARGVWVFAAEHVGTVDEIMKRAGLTAPKKPVTRGHLRLVKPDEVH